MRILIITQTINEKDPILGFMVGWITEFAHQCDKVVAIGLSVGGYHLPDNVRVLSLGKEKVQSRMRYLWNFYRYIIREQRNYDAVFVHMNPEYILLGGPLWDIMRKRYALWYAHGHVSPTLQIAVNGADVVFTSTKSGLRITSPKIKVIGQGIDIEKFSLHPRHWNKTEPFKLLIVGRISPVKDYETLLRAGKRLIDSGKNIHIDIVGGAGLQEQEVYLKQLQELVTELGIDTRVTFHGAIPNTEIVPLLDTAQVFVNNSRTGSLDKAMVEAMATGLPTLSSNIAMQEVFGELSKQLMFPEGDDEVLARNIIELMDTGEEERNKLGEKLRDIVVQQHSLKALVGKILAGLERKK